MQKIVYNKLSDHWSTYFSKAKFYLANAILEQ